MVTHVRPAGCSQTFFLSPFSSAVGLPALTIMQFIKISFYNFVLCQEDESALVR